MNAPFRLDALRVGGEILAVAGSSVRHGTNIVEFGAVRAHEPTLSPGDFLFHQMIKRACEDGMTAFDFGVGDEPYKRAWCDVETQHFETVRGIGARGLAYAQLLQDGQQSKARHQAQRVSVRPHQKDADAQDRRMPAKKAG